MDVAKTNNLSDENGLLPSIFYGLLYINNKIVCQPILEFLENFEIYHSEQKMPFVIQLYRTHIFLSFAYSTLLSILFFTSHNGLHWKEEGVETTDVSILW